MYGVKQKRKSYFNGSGSEKFFFGADDPLRKSVNLDALPTKTINQLCSVLFGARKPIENEIWERWFSSLKAWLQLDRPPS